MFKVYFENQFGEFKQLGSGSKEDCKRFVYDFLKNHKFKSYYTVVSKVKEGVERWDVGSHSEFFWLLDEKTACSFF